MASQKATQEIPQAAQAQPVSDAVMQEALDKLAKAQSAQNDNTSYTSQASNFMQQTGEQVKNMAQGAGEQVKNIAQGATDAVKNTLGMNADTNTNASNNTTPTDTLAGAGVGAGTGATATNPSSLTAGHPSNPTNNVTISTSNPRI